MRRCVADYHCYDRGVDLSPSARRASSSLFFFSSFCRFAGGTNILARLEKASGKEEAFACGCVQSFPGIGFISNINEKEAQSKHLLSFILYCNYWHRIIQVERREIQSQVGSKASSSPLFLARITQPVKDYTGVKNYKDWRSQR